MEQSALSQRYRRDRRKLLEFLLSSGLIQQLRTPAGPATVLSDIDFDTISADYVIDCIKSGGVVDISEATKKYHDESTYPVMIHSKLGDSYFLLSDPDLSGSPPRRVPPHTDVNQVTKNASCSYTQLDPLIDENIETIRNDNGFIHQEAIATTMKPVDNSKIPPLGLPSLITGLSDDDLRESAYEILIASMVFSGAEVYSVEDRKKEKSLKFLSGLKSRKDKTHLQSQSLDRYSELLDIVRVQMQISEARDACIRKGLMQFAARRAYGQIDIPQISLVLLNSIFRSDFLNEKSYMQWKSRQANILEELLKFSADVTITEHLTIRSHLAKVKDEKEWDTTTSPSVRAEVLSAIGQVASKLSSLPGHFGIQSETYYWTAGYHLNIRLYEKLLIGVFDVLDEGQLIMEADEILLLIKLTWSTLGITQRLHNAIYGWVLFQQFVGTEEVVLLEYATLELQKVGAEDDDEKEGKYTNSLVCLRQCSGSETELNLVQAIFFSISIWCDNKLQDYHLHFSQEPCNFRTFITLVLAVGVITSGDSDGIKLIKLNPLNDNVARKFKTYVERSIKAAYRRVADTIYRESRVEMTHPLAFLANELRLIAEREFSVFFPVLRHWCPESGTISAILLHQFYGERLQPFLKGVSCLSEDVKSVLPAADVLDRYLTLLYNSAFEENRLHHPLNQDLDHYQVGEVCKPIILDWVIAQHARILEWTGRAFDLEDWEPLSFQQRQAASIIEVFRIVEETVDQFFDLNLPMDDKHLQALLSIIFHSLNAYLLNMLNRLVEKNHLYLPAPPLTRYTETVVPVIKKKLLECTHLDDNVRNKLHELTVSKLSIRLNTLQYIQRQIGVLEDGIRKSWKVVRKSDDQICASEEPLETSERDSVTCDEAVDMLFATTLNIIKDSTADAISKICYLIGARVVFWDLRDTFLFHLYRGNVEGVRLDSILPHVDTVLDHICRLIDDAVRDLVVLSICRALLEGYLWVLLDGGPSRAFSDSDVMMMEDDLNMLKEFFIADGEGLPRSLVEEEAKSAEQILSLFSLQTESLIQMLMSASEHISSGLDSHDHGLTCFADAHTLIRVLCHKKDREASKFLKKQYQLPMSSEYDDTPSRDSISRSPLISDLKRSTSFHWNKKGQSSFKSIKKKFQEATSEIRNAAR